MGEHKLSQAEVFESIVLGMTGNNPVFPEFPHKFHVIEPGPGIRELLVEDSPGRVQFCDLGGLTGSVLNYTNKNISLPQYLLTFKHAQEVAKMWMYSVKPIDMPKMFAFTGDKSLAFHRAPFPEPMHCEEPPPLFADILARSSEPRALAAFVGSLFYEKADRQQYLFIHGDGRNGKSALIDVLNDTLGPGVHTETTPDDKRPPGSHWTASFLGKRLVVFSECESPRFPTSAIFKSLTGGDKTLINQKFKAAYSTKLNCKFIFLANGELQISSSTADQRRAIYCFIKRNLTHIEDYAEKLRAEASQIIGYCMKVYSELCPNHGSIPVDKAAAGPAMLDIEQEMFFDSYFDLNPNGMVPLQVIQLLFAEAKIGRSADQSKFYTYARLTHQCEKVCVGDRKHRFWALTGISLAKSAGYDATELNNKILRRADIKVADCAGVKG
ncbi:MAG: DUF5906 domain-containing protein [Leptolyngbyaceae bacterium]|nr:DUF5906 domain-containing protein [Leptolyngbyaceae bacterium]